MCFTNTLNLIDWLIDFQKKSFVSIPFRPLQLQAPAGTPQSLCGCTVRSPKDGTDLHKLKFILQLPTSKFN